jgi:hypothetical protein
MFARHSFALLVLGVLAIASFQAYGVQVRYNFDNAGNTGSVATDSLTSDGTQNGHANYSGWTLVPNSGPASQSTTTAEFGSTSYGNIMTDAVINYPTAMTWSAAVRRTAPTFDNGASGYTTLFWAGWQRGTGETELAITPNGSLSWYQGGKGTFTTTATNLSVLNVWQPLGITFDSAVGGGTLIFYVNGAAVQTITGVGAMLGNGNAASETVFGQEYNVGGTSQFFGRADNIFIADRALSASEMFDVQYIPEPSTMGMLTVSGVMMLRRRRSV